MGKNILLIAGSLDAGSVDSSVVDVAVVLAGRGFGITVASAGGRMVKELKKAGVEHVLLPVNSSDWFVQKRSARGLCDIIRARGVGLVHAFTPKAARLAFRVSRRMGVPYVASFMKIPAEGWFARLFSPLKYLVRGGFVIVPSEYMAEFVQTDYKVPSDRIIIVPQWIDADVFNANSVSAARIISVAGALRIPEDHFIIASVSKVRARGGHDVLLQAVAKLPEEKRRSLRLLIIGGYERRARADLERQARRLGVDGLVHIVGETGDLPALLMLSDVYVSHGARPQASYPRILEAQSLGRPIVAANVGAAAEYMLGGETGRMFEAKNAQDLSLALDWALGLGKDERGVLSKKLAAHIRLNFGRSSLPAKIGSIYDFVLGGKQG